MTRGGVLRPGGAENRDRGTVTTLAALTAQGVAVTWGPLKREAFARAEITDPDGNAIELRQWYNKR
jgi:hypothetical protein